MEMNLVNKEVVKTYIVENQNTAYEVGSGGLYVLATPEIVRLVENISYNMVQEELIEEETTVGGYIDINHLKPTLVGKTIQISVVLKEICFKKLVFEYIAYEGDIKIATGKHERYIVNKEKFMTKAI